MGIANFNVSILGHSISFVKKMLRRPSAKIILDKMKLILIGVAIAVLCAPLSLSGCNSSAVHDTVLSPGDSIAARNRFGVVRIVYVGPTTRRFEFDGQSKIVRMTQRPERFDRRFGIYDAADSWGISGAVRIVCDESVIDFDTLDELYSFLSEQSEVLDWVYTPNGLVVGFGRSPGRNQINVNLYQLLVRGKKPQGLRNARPALIHIAARPGA